MFRTLSFAMVMLGTLLHLIGFVTDHWIEATLDTRGLKGVMKASDMGNRYPVQVGMSVYIGLWKGCVKVEGDFYEVPAADSISVCRNARPVDLPDWMKAVQALGIMSVMAAAAVLGLMIYSSVSQGERITYIIGATCLLAGILLLLAVIVFGSEFSQMMADQWKLFHNDNPSLRPVVSNLQDHTILGYSFALEVIAALLFLPASVMVVFPTWTGRRDGDVTYNIF